MEIVKINVNPLRNDHTHKRKPLGSQAISSRVIRASSPFHTREVDPIEIGERV